MRSLFAVLRQLILPAGSLPSAPQLVLGPSPVPPELVTYYATLPDNHTVVTGVLYRQDLTNYDYDILIVHKVSAVASRAAGVVVAGAVHELNRMTPVGTSATQTYGQHEASFIELRGGSALLVNGFPSLIQVMSGGSILVQLGATLAVALGGTVTYDNTSGPRELLPSINRTNNGIVVTTPAGGAETAVPTANWDAEPNVTYRDTGLWRAFVSGFTDESTGAGGVVSLVRMRKGQATVAGTQLGLAEVFHPAGFGGLTQSFTFAFYFKNTSGSAVTTRLSLTIQGVFGAGTVSLYGDANMALRIEVQDVGNVADHADLAADAVSL